MPTEASMCLNSRRGRCQAGGHREWPGQPTGLGQSKETGLCCVPSERRGPGDAEKV